VSTAAGKRLRRGDLGPFADRFVLGDSFEFDYGRPFDVIYERTFLCAMPRRLWPRDARRTAARLASFFCFSDEPTGAPFGTRPDVLAPLLSAWFVPVDDRAVEDSMALFGAGSAGSSGVAGRTDPPLPGPPPAE
jgi:hypothetical protein